MANLKEIRSRITSVGSTMQITSAMKMVSAAKLKRAQDAIIQMRPYANKLTELLENLSASLDSSDGGVYSQEREIKNVLLVTVTSNRGLCGGFNAYIMNRAKALINEDYANANVSILSIGKKSSEHFSKNGFNVVSTHDALFGDLTFDNVAKIAEGIMEKFVAGDYDKVVLATHADEALKLIENPTKDEKDILSKFNYKENVAYIHTDQRAMPNNKKVWSSWNSSIDNLDLKKNSITYWLNLLENLKCDENIFLTLNPYFKIDEKKVLKKVKFTHPYYDQKALDAQSELNKLQNKKDLLFCGSYFGYGFHEDGIKSSIEMLKNFDD